MIDSLLPPDFITPLPDLHLDMEAAERVLACTGSGLRAYAEAGGLDPARDFRGLDLCGWDLAGQDLRGFDFSGCDLRGTGIEYAIVDSSTTLDEAVLDEGVVAGGDASVFTLGEADLTRLAARASDLYDAQSWSALAAAGRSLLPLLASQFGGDHPDMLRLSGYIGIGEVRHGNPAAGRARLTHVLATEHAQGTADADTDLLPLVWRFYAADALLDLGRAKEALAEFGALLPLEIKLRGAEDPSTLTTRQYRALALLDLGRAKDAFAEFDVLLPLYEKLRGADDPGTLTTRYTRARALLELGRAREALAEFAKVKLGYIAAKGRDHWWVSSADSEAIGCRMALGELGFSDELRRLGDHIANQTYAHIPLALRARYRIARALVMEGQPSAARTEINALLALAAAQDVTGYRYLQAARRLAATLDGTDDGAGLPY